MSVRIRRLNHAVLYVRDARRSARFYGEVLGFALVAEDPAGRFAFLRAGGSDNHHDLALFSVGSDATPSRAGAGEVGLYHLAWEVGSLDELAEVHERLVGAGALVGASDHGVSRSLYGHDLDGIEFEVMWAVPAEQWGSMAHEVIVRPLDLRAELDRARNA